MLPNKITPYARSTIAKFPPILKQLTQSDLSVSELYKSVKDSEIGDASEFLNVIDCLYALGMVDYDEERRVLRHVEGNTVQ